MDSISERVARALDQHYWATGPDDWTPVTDEVLDRCEREFGFPFPVPLREFFLQAQRADGKIFSLAPHINREGISSALGSIELHVSPWDMANRWYAVDESGLYNSSEGETEQYRQWLLKYAYPIGMRGHDTFFLDFAFDPLDPPVVVISDEISRGRKISFVASNLLSLLEFPVVEHDPNDLLHVDHVIHEAFKQPFEPLPRRVDWQRHRDTNISPSNADDNQRRDEHSGLNR